LNGDVNTDNCYCADMNRDGILDGLDFPCFIQVWKGSGDDCQSTEPCPVESMMGGGESSAMSGGSPGPLPSGASEQDSNFDPETLAWLQFYSWLRAQDWPETDAERLALKTASNAKLIELGLPQLEN
jgi:hypothetical protein